MFLQKIGSVCQVVEKVWQVNNSLVSLLLVLKNNYKCRALQVELLDLEATKIQDTQVSVNFR